MNYLITCLIGLVAGISSGLFGIGGGIVMVPAMMFFLKIPIKIAIGTSLAVIIPAAIAGVFKHSTLHNVNWSVAALLIPGAFIGAYIGAWLTSIIGQLLLKRMFGVVLVIVGLRMLLMKQ
jgi:uncharacterized membrane protein YfcA